MATGLQKNRMRQEALADLGKGLARRAGSRCELCHAGGVGLVAFEVRPVPETPDPDRIAFICEQCIDGAEGGRLVPERWRFLETAVWSEVPAVQVLAVRLCRRLYEDGQEWAGNILAGLYLAPEVEEWLES